ncbi:MAG: D-isomer specific 2-hydroxyacid dehydrogenase family protein [Legionella sp.]|jgi:phosphoglycerate dehydrogenase-like enzyme
MLKIIITGSGYSEHHFAKLRSIGFEITHRPDDVSAEKLQTLLPEFDAYVLGGDERLNAQELQHAKKLRVISFVGTGYSSFIDATAAQKHNIAIRNTPEVMAAAVAEHTIGFLIGQQRQLFQQNWQVKNSCITPVRTEELSSLCVGIVGLGAIGSRIAKILRMSFGSEVIYTSRSSKKTLESELSIKSVSMDTLFSTSDVIILALPTNDETEYFVNESLLAKTKPGVMLINTAGARLIEPKAFKKYLDSNHIQSAAMDGYYIEPLPSVADDPYQLLSLPDNKLVITSHTAAKTSQSWDRMVDMAIDNVVQFFV